MKFQDDGGTRRRGGPQRHCDRFLVLGTARGTSLRTPVRPSQPPTITMEPAGLPGVLFCGVSNEGSGVSHN